MWHRSLVQVGEQCPPHHAPCSLLLLKPSSNLLYHCSTSSSFPLHHWGRLPFSAHLHSHPLVPLPVSYMNECAKAFVQSPPPNSFIPPVSLQQFNNIHPTWVTNVHLRPPVVFLFFPPSSPSSLLLCPLTLFSFAKYNGLLLPIASFSLWTFFSLEKDHKTLAQRNTLYLSSFLEKSMRKWLLCFLNHKVFLFLFMASISCFYPFGCSIAPIQISFYLYSDDKDLHLSLSHSGQP